MRLECEPDLRIILGRFRVGAVGSQLQSGLRNLKSKKFWTSNTLYLIPRVKILCIKNPILPSSVLYIQIKVKAFFIFFLRQMLFGRSCFVFTTYFFTYSKVLVLKKLTEGVRHVTGMVRIT
jgi:hypothetical protein